MGKKRFYLVFSILTLMILTVGCSGTTTYKHITLSNLQPNSSPAKSDNPTLRVALATGLSPSQSIARYQALTNYLSEKLHRPVELVQRKTYKEVDDLIREGQVDIAFVCSSSYAIGKDGFGERLVAVPISNGLPYYQSLIIVNASTGIRNWDQLQGHSFAFVDPQSTSGALYALSKIKDRGGLKFFSSYIYTYGHINSITAVRDHLVDAAAVDSTTFTAALAKLPDLNSAIRVIDISPQYTNNPVVASPRLDEQTLLNIQEALMDMDKDELGQQALQVAGFDKFQLLDDKLYDSVRTLVQQIGEGDK
ncbi:MAG: phosphate/phosphite/phosphonate ABC transporter substrate-binding protein [Desulfitobacteriaceae bacterium]|nr:phosphate/phosphite/phosphonate ABC transporter substrate-binding protein [Desulfitobacteriaceae bacterium]MDI6913749.1 phosphate/phosphite/phosphonate ABC transporter substrate-binding protein [Desulfitobacteriaceae bacterium]